MTDTDAACAPHRAALLTFEGVTFGFPGRGALFQNFSIQFRPGITAVMGASGAGKSTLLRLALGRLTPVAGRIAGTQDRRLAWLGQTAGLLPWASAEDALLLGSRLRGEPLNRDRARRMLAEAGLGGHEASRPAAMSGGMQQRVGLARVAMEDASIILLDEPFAHLDVAVKARLYAFTRQVFAARTVVMVTHDPIEALTIADRAVVLAGQPLRIVADVAIEAAAPRDPRSPTLDAAHAALTHALEAA